MMKVWVVEFRSSGNSGWNKCFANVYVVYAAHSIAQHMASETISLVFFWCLCVNRWYYYHRLWAALTHTQKHTHISSHFMIGTHFRVYVSQFLYITVNLKFRSAIIHLIEWCRSVCWILQNKAKVLSALWFGAESSTADVMTKLAISTWYRISGRLLSNGNQNEKVWSSEHPCWSHLMCAHMRVRLLFV